MADSKTITVCALSTIDNPFNPIDDYDKWFSYDVSHGYNTSNWLGNLAKTSDLLSNEDNMKEIEDAIDEIVNVDPNFYIKVTKQMEK
jgi:hypothetical protein